MIVIVIIAAICTGAVCGAVIGGVFDLPEFAKIIIMVFTAFVTEFGILAYTKRERDKEFDLSARLYEKIVNLYKTQDKENAEMLEVCWRDLRKADINCQYCRHGQNPDIMQKCITADCDCEICGANCPCKTCNDKSHWEWNGGNES